MTTELHSFDGKGINDMRSEYRPRIVTFASPEYAKEFGNMFAAAPKQNEALKKAEAFIAGFEGDELQEGIDELLKEIRAALLAANGESINNAQHIQVAEGVFVTDKHQSHCRAPLGFTCCCVEAGGQ